MPGVVSDFVEVSSELCTGKVTLDGIPGVSDSQERALFGSSVVKMVTAYTFSQGTLHPAKASSLSPLENPFLAQPCQPKVYIYIYV